MKLRLRFPIRIIVFDEHELTFHVNHRRSSSESVRQLLMSEVELKLVQEPSLMKNTHLFS